jgi:hypothetical protein
MRDGVRDGGRAGARRARDGAVTVQIGPAPRMRPLVPARPLVRAGGEDFREHPSRLMPECWEPHWAEKKVSR